jgi:hypothetical protein
MTKPKEIRPGLISSINASYTIHEIQSILSKTDLKSSKVKKDNDGLHSNWRETFEN